MEPEDIIRLKQLDEQSKNIPEIEEEQKQLFSKLGRMLKLKMLNPTNRNTNLLRNLIKQVQTTK